MIAFEDQVRAGGATAIRSASAFFARNDRIHQTLREIAERLHALGVPYAVVGGMALVAHGYLRTTVDVDVLVDAPGLELIQTELPARGYVRSLEGSQHLRNTRTGVRVAFLVAGQFPGDGQPKPIAFPDPATVATEIDGVRYVGLPTLIELKLASGMTNPGRLKDLADVQEVIRMLKLPRAFSEHLNEYVRTRFVELYDAVAGADESADE